MIGPRMAKSRPTTRMTICNWPLPSPSRESDRLRPRPPYQSERRTISERMTILPSMTAASVMNCTSWFLRWPISWAITPWSSSRLRRYIRPVVTVMELVSGLRPDGEGVASWGGIVDQEDTRHEAEARMPTAFLLSTTLKSCGLSSFLSWRAFAPAGEDADSALVK